MDRTLLKTFMEIVSAGSLLAAAERLHISQTAVTVRLQRLEQQLGCALFVRNRKGARLTPEGERFAPHAQRLLSEWRLAVDALAEPLTEQARLAVGGETSLWNPLLSGWLQWAQQQLGGVQFEACVESAETLLAKLDSGELDAVLVHLPRYHSDYVVELLLEEKLLLAETPSRSGPFYLVDWGPGFREQFEASLPRAKQHRCRVNLGPLALQLMLASGGSGYFRSRVLAPYFDSGQLRRVNDAPEFSYPVYLLTRRGERSLALSQMLEGLRQQAAEEKQWQL